MVSLLRIAPGIGVPPALIMFVFLRCRRRSWFFLLRANSSIILHPNLVSYPCDDHANPTDIPFEHLLVLVRISCRLKRLDVLREELLFLFGADVRFDDVRVSYKFLPPFTVNLFAPNQRCG